MVTRLRNQPGTSRLGCLFTIMVLGAAAFVGKNVGEVYFRSYRLRDYVKEQALFAPVLSDVVIRRRLVDFSDYLGLDLGPRDWLIRRTSSPRQITIKAQYEDSIVIEVFAMRKVWKMHFKPYIRLSL